MTNTFISSVFVLVFLHQWLLGGAHVDKITRRRDMRMIISQPYEENGAGDILLNLDLQRSRMPKVIHAAAAATIFLIPTIALAATNPDAIDVKRVDQEPAMAPQAPRRRWRLYRMESSTLTPLRARVRKLVREIVQFEWVCVVVMVISSTHRTTTVSLSFTRLGTRTRLYRGLTRPSEV